jgi:hypothetical protein
MTFIEQVKKIISTLPHSEVRVPYTYHHDYLRMYCQKFYDASRADVAANHIENENELYAVALTYLLHTLSYENTYHIEGDEKEVCLKAMAMTKHVIERYKNNLS